MKTLAVAKKKCKDLSTKLTKVEREKKSVEVMLAGAKRQAEEQYLHLWKTEEQLAIVHEKIEAQQKELEGKVEEIANAK